MIQTPEEALKIAKREHEEAKKKSSNEKSTERTYPDSMNPMSILHPYRAVEDYDEYSVYVDEEDRVSYRKLGFRV